MTTGERIRALRLAHGMTMEELAQKIGLQKAAIYKYETGLVVNLKRDVVEKLAAALNVQPSYIMCMDDAVRCPTLPGNIVPLPKMKQIPLVGQIACGTPITAEENIEDLVDLPGHIRADFALTCKGDSMIRAGIQDGDVVYIREQPEVENGQIAAVMVGDGEATLKRFYRAGDVVTLVAENPTVQPFVFTGEDLERLRVVGLAVAFTHALQ